MNSKRITFRVSFIFIFLLLTSGCGVHKRLYTRGFYFPYSKHRFTKNKDNIKPGLLHRDESHFFSLYHDDVSDIQYKGDTALLALNHPSALVPCFVPKIPVLKKKYGKKGDFSLLRKNNVIRPDYDKEFRNNGFFKKSTDAQGFYDGKKDVPVMKKWSACGKDYEKGLRLAKNWGWTGIHRFYMNKFLTGFCLFFLLILSLLYLWGIVAVIAGSEPASDFVIYLIGFLLFGSFNVSWWLVDVSEIKHGNLYPRCSATREIEREEAKRKRIEREKEMERRRKEEYEKRPVYDILITGGSRADGTLQACIRYEGIQKTTFVPGQGLATYVQDPYSDYLPKINWEEGKRKILVTCREWGYKDFRLFENFEKEKIGYSRFQISWTCQCVNTIVHPELFPEQEQENPDKAEKEFLMFGTGFLINKAGYVITNYHVVEKARKIKIFDKQKNMYYSAQLIAQDVSNDLALLKINDKNYIPADFGLYYGLSKTKIAVSDKVFCLGYPDPRNLGKNIKYVEGAVSSLTGFRDNTGNFQISAPVYPGNSGSPVFNEKGEIIGVIVAGYTKGDNVNYAIKKEILELFLNENGISFPVSAQGSTLNQHEKIENIKRNIFLIECE